MGERNVIEVAPDDFRRTVGTIVFEFAALESVASEIITNKYRNAVANGGWAQSGVQFIKELRKCFPKDLTFNALCDELAGLGQWRNMYIHSEWMFFDDGSASLMKRSHHKGSSHPVTFEMNNRVDMDGLETFISQTIRLTNDFAPFVHQAWEGRYVQG